MEEKEKDKDQGNPKRRRGLGIVTPNACTECRKKRAKVSINLRHLLNYLKIVCHC